VVFRRLRQAFGVGGPQVDTVLHNPNTRPGLGLEGQVNIQGGDHEVHIDYVELAMVTKVEVETDDSEYDSTVAFARLRVTGAFPLAPGQPVSVPFQFPVPWETPITDVFGQHLHGMTMGLRTELEVARALDKGDLDAVNVHPLPIQERILEGFGRLGFRFKGADLERGHLRGVHQTLPFYQEIEFHPAPQYAGKINEVEVTFVAARTASTSCWSSTSAAACSPRGPTPSAASRWVTTTPTRSTGPSRSTAGYARSRRIRGFFH
jgi:sporulation-control protein